jgi:hypothetical protein
VVHNSVINQDQVLAAPKVETKAPATDILAALVGMDPRITAVQFRPGTLLNANSTPIPWDFFGEPTDVTGRVTTDSSNNVNLEVIVNSPDLDQIVTGINLSGYGGFTSGWSEQLSPATLKSAAIPTGIQLTNSSGFFQPGQIYQFNSGPYSGGFGSFSATLTRACYELGG